MSTDASEYDDDLARLQQYVGKLSGAVRYEIIDALDEDHDGVLALAQEIHDNPRLDRKGGAFIAAIRSGDHVGKEPDEHLDRAIPYEPPAAFRGFFLEYEEWLHDITDLGTDERVERALDYAVGSMSVPFPRIHRQLIKVKPYAKGESALTLETAMRDELNRPRPETTGGERARMGSEWGVIHYSMHDDRIRGMHQALMEQCAIPGEPTHVEARDARAALIEEIRALDVKPQIASGPVEVEGWTSIGQAARDAVADLAGARPGSGLRTDQRYCRSGSKCVIAVAGHGAALSRINDSSYCQPCQERRSARNA